MKLAKLWSTKGLLALFDSPPPGNLFSRVFNNYKNEVSDRQIGDRRLANAAEFSIAGPSRRLPIGFMMTSLHCPPGYQLHGSITDRKDFYHQAAVTREKAHLNCLPFRYDLHEFDGLVAKEELEEIQRLRRRRRRREDEGDLYGINRIPLGVIDEQKAYPAFQSLFQGDHLGVEFALSAHHSLLSGAGVLSSSSIVLSKHPFPSGALVEGLVIDDYFSVSCEKVGYNGPTLSGECFDAAQAAYSKHKVLGSSEKDIKNATHFKIVGAEVNTSKRALSNRVALVGAPVGRRLSLAALSLRIARSHCISRAIASRLAGGWTFVLMYRRSLTCILSDLFGLGVVGGQSEKEILTLPRRVCNELVVASALSFVATSNVAASYDKRVYATDASLRKGAVVSSPQPPEIVKTLWLGGDKKGAYTQLDSGFRSALKTHGFGSDDVEDLQEECDRPIPTKGLDFSFDFVEVCGGQGSVSKAAARMGLTVCTPIELSDSRCYDLRNLRLVQWVVHMLQVGRFKSIMLEPPCTTWSPAAHPAVRSYSNPRGFNMLCQKTLGGNITAFRSLLIAYVARENERPCLLETPFLSKMAWLSVWRFLLRCKSFQEAVCASCAFGSPHLKQFRLLTYGLDAEELTVRCKGGHKHLRIEGKLTKASSVYVPALAEHFARAFYKALRRIDDQHENEPTVKGLESVAINDVLMSGSWQLEHCWHWKVAAHINVLESNAYLSLLKRLARHESEALRFVALLDSRVAKGAHAKGRSTSWALGPSLRKAAAVSVGAGLYSSLGFAPTRLNTADDPARDVSIRPSSERSCLRNLSLSQIRALQSVQLSRSAANWVRLWILLSLCDCSDATSLSADHIFRHASSQSTSEVPHHFAPFVSFGLWTFLLICLWILLSLSCLPVGRFSVWGTPKEKRGRQPIHRSHCPLIVFAFIPLSQAMPYGSGATGDRLRAQRRASVELVADRAVRPQTRSQRDNLLVAFDSWLGQWGWSLATAVDVKDVDAEFVARLLVQYGRELYYSGKPYGYYSETINGVAARRPALRRQLAHAWDLAFAWVADEPVAHHPPIPKSILLALCGLALLWGWPCEAAIFLMSWSGLLRIGEAISATRADLILPADAAPGTSFALLRIRAPKTRGVGARHQAARFDQKDVVELLDAVFYDYPRDKKLWSYSSTTLRKRMNSLQGALGLVGTGGNSQPPYDLGSFRPGGATYYLQLFEDPDFVRRRGRWLSHKSMEIYLQEVATATFHHRLSTDARRRISEVVLHFPRILVQSCWFLKHGIPPCSWCHLWSTPA